MTEEAAEARLLIWDEAEATRLLTLELRALALEADEAEEAAEAEAELRTEEATEEAADAVAAAKIERQ